MGPPKRFLGSLVPEVQIWQDPVPKFQGTLIGDAEIKTLKESIIGTGIPPAHFMKAAWASAATFRGTDHRGGTNGARITLAPQNTWECNDPEELKTVLDALGKLKEGFPGDISTADLIVLAGCAGVEAAAAAGGVTVSVPFSPGRGDATVELTDADSFAVLESFADGFRNYIGSKAMIPGMSPEAFLVDKARMLNLTKSEMAALVGGMRVTGCNAGGSTLGVFTDKPGTLSNDFFVTLMDMNVKWETVIAEETKESYEAKDRKTGEVKWKASR
jgi:catalase-peroxidase